MPKRAESPPNTASTRTTAVRSVKSQQLVPVTRSKVSTSVVRKATTRKKAPATATKPAAAGVKSTRARTVASKTRTPRVKKTTLPASTKSAPKAQAEEVVRLVTGPTERLRERVLLLAAAIPQDWHGPMVRFAYAGGACFAILGFALVIASPFATKDAQVATLIASTCDSTQTECPLSSQAEVVTVVPPAITTLSALPSQLETEVKFVFAVTGVPEPTVRVKLYSFNDGTATDIDFDTFADSYSVTIDPTSLVGGTYKLIIRSANNVGQADFETTRFTVLAPRLVARTEPVGPAPVSTTSTSTPENTEDVSEVVEATTTTNTATVTNAEPESGEEPEILEVSSVTSNNEVATEPSVVPTPAEETVQEEIATNEPAPPTFTAVRRSAALDGLLQFEIALSAPTTRMDVYLRRANSLAVTYVGAARRFDERQWRFFLVERSYPAGEYFLFAKTTIDGTEYRSNGVKFVIAPPLTTTVSTPTTQPTTPTAPAPVNVTSEPAPVTENTEAAATAPAPAPTVATAPALSSSTPVRPRATTTTQIERPLAPELSTVVPTVSQNTRNLVEPLSERVINLLQAQEQAVTESLKRFAAATQANDPILKEAARAELAEQREQLKRALVESESGEASDSALALTALEAEFVDLERKVEAFEQLRRERLNEVEERDSDADGITDVDEQLLFNTDPLVNDTDGDGIPDGVELARGFDPTNPSDEAVIEYESPKAVIAPVQSEVLTIETVLPVTVTTPDADVAPVQATIRGRALPDSFVTLYIFSTPTIVTVRTDADGSFEYTFAQELADGQHEVYVAVTDNVGSIVARSNPFTFVKQAQAFTPVDAAESAIVTSEPITETAVRDAYNIAAGVGILALGLILLMFGMNLRASRPNEYPMTVPKPIHPV